MPLRLRSLAAQRLPRARHLVIACGLAIGLVLPLGTAGLILQTRQDDLANAGRELKNLSLVLSEETDRAFQSAELVQHGLMNHLRNEGIDTPAKFEHDLNTQAVQLELQQRIVGLPHVNSLALVSRDGAVLSISRVWPVTASEATSRDYFLALTRDPAKGCLIGLPLRNRINAAWTIPFACAFTGADGKLIGLVRVGLQIDLFERLFAGITIGDDATISLYRADGVLLARYPRPDTGLGRTYGSPEDFSQLQASVDHGVVTRISVIDGKTRLIAPHSVAHYPLLLTASNTARAVLAPWRARTRWISGIAAIAELVLAGFVWLSVRQLRGQERLGKADAAAALAEAARARAEAELALARQREASGQAAHLQSQRFDVALNNMVQGLIMVDAAGRLVVVNRRFVELCGLPADSAQFVETYTELLDLIFACGNFTAHDIANLRDWRPDQAAQQTTADFIWELNDGRAFKIAYQPMPDGWLATYEEITESRRAEVRMAYMARHDPLTDLPNRTLFHEKLQAALAHTRRGDSLALLCLGLDQFKAVNDTLGHPVGDALLQAVARRLLDRVRDTDILARLGGDEFAVVQAQIARPEEAAIFAERLMAILEEPFEVAGHKIVIGTSVGIALGPHDGSDSDELLKSADLALYRAKLEGRGVYRLFQVGMDAQMQARRVLELDLRHALNSGQFELFYQPLIDLRAREVSGFEALLRWRHPLKGLVAPDAFIPLAEEIGAIVPLGAWVLRSACATAARWPNAMKVAVNLSAVQFKAPDLVATVAAALLESGLDPERLELEITETVLLRDTDATLATLRKIHALGVHIAMDDFGTGYSSLSYLRQFPFDRIKIDQSFIRELGKVPDCAAIVHAITMLGRELGMATTAEGVETQEQLAELAMAGCTDVQGYLFSRPVPEGAIAEMLRTMPSIRDMLPPGSVRMDLQPAGGAVTRMNARQAMPAMPAL
jgi:diguanylate cyclase (GGDEF)-like protein